MYYNTLETYRSHYSCLLSPSLTVPSFTLIAILPGKKCISCPQIVICMVQQVPVSCTYKERHLHLSEAAVTFQVTNVYYTRSIINGNGFEAWFLILSLRIREGMSADESAIFFANLAYIPQIRQNYSNVLLIARKVTYRNSLQLMCPL